MVNDVRPQTMPNAFFADLGLFTMNEAHHWRAHPDEETTGWRAHRGKTANRVQSEGTAFIVSYPYATYSFISSVAGPGALNPLSNSMPLQFPL